MENKTYRTNELERCGQPTGYVVWFRLVDGSRVSIEMSLGGLIQLQGLINRSVERLGGAVPDEMNAYPAVTGGTLEAAAGAAPSL